MATVLVPVVQGVVACNRLGSKMAGHPRTSPHSPLVRSGHGQFPSGDWTQTWPPAKTSSGITAFLQQGSLKESRCVRVIWLLANITAVNLVNLCLGNTLRMNLHRTEVTIGKKVAFCL